MVRKLAKQTCFALYNVTLYWAYKRQTAVLKSKISIRTNYLFLVLHAANLNYVHNCTKKMKNLGFKNKSVKAIYGDEKRHT